MKKLLFTQEVRNWIIYKITSPTGRVYIGKTCKEGTRMSCYRTLNCKCQPFLYKSLKKYGFENHSIDTIDSFEGDNEYANGKEIFWIRSWMSNSKRWISYYKYDKGLNLTDGAEGMLGYKYSEESKRKMSIAGKGKPKYKLRGIPLSEQTKNKLSEKAKLRPPPNLGKKLSQERKDQIGASKIGNTYMLGKKHTAENIKKMCDERAKKYGKPIIQYNLDGSIIKEYPSMRMAYRETGVARNVIKDCVRGVTKKPQRFIFKYK